jgi:prolipoprotein diacylglyceryltransferase
MASWLMKYLNVTSSGELIYKLTLIGGFILAYVWFHIRIKRRLKIKEHVILLTFLVIVGIGVLGGMYLGDGIGLLLFGFLPNIEAIVPVGILVTILLVITITKSVLKTSFTTISDSLALPLALGYPLGRIGCLFNGCCYGSPTNLWIGRLPTLLGNSKVNIHPTQLCYIISAVIVLLVLIYFEKRKDINFPGFITLLAIFCYSAFTFAIAFFRGDYISILSIGKIGINPEHIVSATFMFLSLFVMVNRRRKFNKQGKTL